MAFGRGAPIQRERDGSISVALSEQEQVMIKSLLAQLRTLLKVEGESEITEDSGIRRLFPTAYPQQEELEAEYRDLVRDDLLSRRLAAIDEMEETIGLPRLDDDQLTTWLTTINDLRLVLGTRLDVSEDDDPFIDPDDPVAAALLAYHYLGELLDCAVAALSTALPEPTEPD